MHAMDNQVSDLYSIFTLINLITGLIIDTIMTFFLKFFGIYFEFEMYLMKPSLNFWNL